MLQHISFGPVLRITATIVGGGTGALIGMIKGATLDKSINSVVDTINGIWEACGSIKKVAK